MRSHNFGQLKSTCSLALARDWQAAETFHIPNICPYILTMPWDFRPKSPWPRGLHSLHVSLCDKIIKIPRVLSR